MSHRGFMGARKADTPASGLLTLEFDNIANAPVADPNSVSDWNTLFNLPALGTSFSSVSVNGNVVTLFNTGTIVLKNEIFNIGTTPRTWLVKFIDTDIITNTDSINSQLHFFAHAGLIDVQMPVLELLGPGTFRDCVGLTSVFFPDALETRRTTSAGSTFRGCTSLVYAGLPKCEIVGPDTFFNCTSLSEVNLPSAKQIAQQAFQNTFMLEGLHAPELLSLGSQAFILSSNNGTMTYFHAPKCTDVLGSNVFRRRTGLNNINLAACTQLGATTGNNSIFSGITGNTINFTLPVGTRTDGDAVELAANNTVTFIDP